MIPFNNLTFLEIPLDSVVHGTKYKIVENWINHTKIYYGKCNMYKVIHYPTDCTLWIDCTIIVSIPKCYNFKNIDYSKHMYVMLPSNSQQKMETRAINMILRNVIGDESFTY